jgi:hypothetical protein
MTDYSKLKCKAQEITNETKDGANTATRVGTVLENIVDALEEQANQDEIYSEGRGVNISADKTISVATDEEDISVNENGKLSLKDRSNTDGMGYVILRKDKSFQEQVKHPNTIYEVRYDFDLGRKVYKTNLDTLVEVGESNLPYYIHAEPLTLDVGDTLTVPSGYYILERYLGGTIASPYTSTARLNVYIGVRAKTHPSGGECEYSIERRITLPENCTLKFEGGSLSNGRIQLNGATIESAGKNIFCNIGIEGTATSIRASWWNLDESNYDIQTQTLKEILNVDTRLTYIDRDFHVVNPQIEVIGKENALLDYYGSHIYVEKSDYTGYSPVTYRCLRLVESAHVTIRGMRATGDVLAQCNNPNFPTEGNLLCHGIDVYDCQNITIDDCIIDEMIGDSVQLGGNSHNKDIHITNCKFSSNRRQGISILCGSDIYIYNCTIKDIGKDIPVDIRDWGCGIDIEPWRGSDYVKNVIIDSCYFGKTEGTNGSNIAVIGTAFSDATESVVSDISITNCSCQGDIFINNVLNTVVERCTLRCIKHRSGGVNDGDVYYATVKTSSLSRIYTDMKASYTIIEDCIVKSAKENKPAHTVWCQGKGVELYNTSILGHDESLYVRILTTETAIIDNCRLDDERYVSTPEDKTEEWIRVDTTKDVRIANSNFDLFYAIVFNDTGNTLVDNCTFAMKRWDDEGATLKEYAVHFRTRYFNNEKSSDDVLLRNNRCKDCNYLYNFYSKTASSYGNNIFIANYILHDTANELVKPDPDPEDNTDGVLLKYQIAENSLRMTSQGIQIYKSWKWQYLNFTLSGTWESKPDSPAIGTWYHCTNKKTAQDDGKGIMIRYVGDGLWADALGEVINAYYPKPKYGTYSQAISISKVVSGGYTYNLPPGSTFFCTDKKTSGDDNSEGTLLIWTGTKWVDSTGAEVI